MGVGQLWVVRSHHHVMKMFIALLLPCMSLLGADTDMLVTTTFQTNAEENVVYSREVFTRAGQTNLLCVTMFKAGKFEVRAQQIYHEGAQLASIATAPDQVTITTTANSPYQVIFDYRPSHALRTITIWTTNGMVVDAFNCKDGILSPEDSSVFRGLGLKK